MPDTTAARCCACRCGAIGSATMAELLANGAVALDLGLAELALVGTTFDGAQVLTSNAGALVEGRGGYGPLQRCGDRFRIMPQRASVRVEDWRSLPVLLSPAATELSVIAPDGRVQHRIRLTEAERVVAQTLPQATPAPLPPAEMPSNVVSLAAIRARRENWHRMHCGEQIDDLIRDGGVARLGSFPALGQQARRLQAGLLASFLDFLCQRRCGLQVTVPATGMAQSLFGKVHTFDRLGQVLICTTDDGRFALDPAQIAQVWAIRHGTRASVEIYGHDGRCIALLGGTDAPWEGYVAAFPSA